MCGKCCNSVLDIEICGHPCCSTMTVYLPLLIINAFNMEQQEHPHPQSQSSLNSRGSELASGALTKILNMLHIMGPYYYHLTTILLTLATDSSSALFKTQTKNCYGSAIDIPLSLYQHTNLLRKLYITSLFTCYRLHKMASRYFLYIIHQK